MSCCFARSVSTPFVVTTNGVNKCGGGDGNAGSLGSNRQKVRFRKVPLGLNTNTSGKANIRFSRAEPPRTSIHVLETRSN